MTESHKLVNVNNQISKFIVGITKSKYIDQDAGHGLWPNLQHNMIISYKLVGVYGHEHLWRKRNSRIYLDARACGLAEVDV